MAFCVIVVFFNSCMTQSQVSCASTYTTPSQPFLTALNSTSKVSLKRLLPVLTRSKTNVFNPCEAHHGIEEYQHHDGSEVEGAMEGKTETQINGVIHISYFDCQIIMPQIFPSALNTLLEGV